MYTVSYAHIQEKLECLLVVLQTMITADENYESSLRFFMRATEVLRHYTQRYYNISGSLYFKNTSVVCWRQVEGKIHIT